MGSISSLGSSVPWNDVRDSGPGPCSSSRPAAEILIRQEKEKRSNQRLGPDGGWAKRDVTDQSVAVACGGFGRCQFGKEHGFQSYYGLKIARPLRVHTA